MLHYKQCQPNSGNVKEFIRRILDSSQVLMEMLGNHVQESEQDKKKCRSQDHLRNCLLRTVLLASVLLDSPLSGIGFLAAINWANNFWP